MASPPWRANGIVAEEVGFTAAKAELLRLTRMSCYAALATSSLDGMPQVAPLRYTVTNDFELVMGTLRTSRKYANLETNDRVAVVIWDDEMSIQIEGRFDEPDPTDEQRLRTHFANELPREAQLRTERPTHFFFRITPTWARCSDFSDEPPRVLTLDFIAQTETRGTFPVLTDGRQRPGL
ncbi:MAG: pyridoxamine 5'-phosphate oxidase family protein [Acidimicrobiales bacterium]|nr:pyridoxamine 5'-phosphate oxidase family protein [Acidimicrobiales bacterium]